jgi:hypothetical protein
VALQRPRFEDTPLTWTDTHRKTLQKSLQEIANPPFLAQMPGIEGEIERRYPVTKSRVTKAVVWVLATVAVLMTWRWQPVKAGPVEGIGYKVLKPIQTGELTLFPIVRTGGRMLPADQFLTLDEGLKSGEVEVTEAGRVRGLERSRSGTVPSYRGDQVNTLVLVNHSKRPLLLLAGEIVTGGKQDRVIAKDRIVPAEADPIDLSVFCIEHGRWTESSAKFGATAKVSSQSFMVQPGVRQQAMVSRDQQQVWDSVHGAIQNMAVAASPEAGIAREGDSGRAEPRVQSGISIGRGDLIASTNGGSALGTTSYAKAMQTDTVIAKVDEASAGSVQNREQALAALRQEHAIGVVVAVRGEAIWADLFSDTELLGRYWTKLVRSYAAEALTSGYGQKAATTEDAQRFLDESAHGRETSEGEVGVYRYREVKSGKTDSFALEALLPGTGYDVHISKLAIKDASGFERVVR